MKARCLNPKNQSFRNYGGRGISIYPAWRTSYGAFLGYVGTRPSPFHSLDRINNDGNYEPGNVRWATRTVQARNRRPSKPPVYVNGVGRSAEEWMHRAGDLHPNVVKTRLLLGWPLADAVSTPFGETRTSQRSAPASVPPLRARDAHL